VSPLLALMRDQLAHLPPAVPAAMLWGAQPRHEQTAVLQNLSVRTPCLRPARARRKPLRTCGVPSKRTCRASIGAPSQSCSPLRPNFPVVFPSGALTSQEVLSETLEFLYLPRRASCGCCWWRRSGCTARCWRRRWHRSCRCRWCASMRRTASASGATTSGRPTSGGSCAEHLLVSQVRFDLKFHDTTACGSSCGQGSFRVICGQGSFPLYEAPLQWMLTASQRHLTTCRGHRQRLNQNLSLNRGA